MRLPALAVAAASAVPCSAQWSTDSLSQARSWLAATSAGSTALFAGGKYAHPGGFSTVVDLYDAATGTWSTASLAAPNVGPSAASAGGLALFAGSDSNLVDVFDSTTGAWSTTSVPTGVGTRGATSVGTRIFFGGGGHAVGSDRVDIYDTASGTWSIEHLSLARGALAATSVGGLALFAGGGYSSTSTSTVDIFDTSTDTWSTAALSVGRNTLAATSVGGKALFAGGLTLPNTFDRVDIYDAFTGTWSQAALSEPRYALTATTVGRFALFAGGMTHAPAHFSDRVDIYDSADGTWSTATLSIPRRRLAATTIGTRALFGGGEGIVSPGYFDYSDAVDVFDARLGTMYCLPVSPNSTGLPGVLAAEGSVFLAMDDFTLIAEQLPPGQFGYFITGLTQGFIQPPASQGPICLSGNVGRYNRASEILQGPEGSLRLDLASMPVNPPTAAMPGDTWNFQCWYRDANPGPTSTTTNAIAVTFATSGDPSVQFAVTQASIVEYATQIDVRITLSQPASHDVLIPWVAGGTATVNVDWRVEESNPFRIPAGHAWADMTLTIAEDGAMEPDETATVSLVAPVGTVPGTATDFTLTIVDDD